MIIDCSLLENSFSSRVLGAFRVPTVAVGYLIKTVLSKNAVMPQTVYSG